MDGPLQDPLRPPQTALALYPFGYCSLPLVLPRLQVQQQRYDLTACTAVLPLYSRTTFVPGRSLYIDGEVLQEWRNDPKPVICEDARFRSSAFRDLYRRSRSLETAPFARVQPVSKGWGSLRPGGRVNSLVPTFRSQTAALE